METNEDNLVYAFNYLKDHTPSLIDQLKFQLDIKTPYELVFKNMDGTPWFNCDIIVTPGNPPTIIVVDSFVIECIAGAKRALYYKDRLRRVVEHLPDMHRTLSNLVPLSKAISLKRDAKRWARDLVPGLVEKIDARYLKVSYTVKVEDTVTGTKITLSGDDPYDLKEDAVKRLSKMVFEREDFEELHEALKEIQLAKSKPKEIQSVSVSGADGESRLKIE